MSNYIVKKLSRINFDFLEKIFFALFLLSIPLQTRLTILTPETYQNGHFNEYATFFIYLSDIFLITTFFLYFVNRLTKYNIFSIKLASFPPSPHLIPIIFLSGFLLWSGLSAGWAEYPNVAFFQSLKLAELILLAIYISNRLLWFGLNKAFTLIFVTGIFQAIIGIGQYLAQKSLGLKLLGESNLSPVIDNVAKIMVNGEKIIRAYGTFPHPNVFASFLILSISCGFWLFLSAKTKGNSQIVSRETIWIKVLMIGIILQLTVLILTFSRISWLTIILLALIWVFWLLRILCLKQKENYEFHPPTFLLKLFHVKQLLNYPLNKPKKLLSEKISAGKRETFLIFITLLLIITALWPQINSRTIDIENTYQQSINYRIFYNDIAIKMIKDHPLNGIGSGGFTLKMNDYSLIPLKWWQYQPAHNIYLLIASELGIIGLILFLVFIFYLLKIAYLKHKSQIVSRETIWLEYLIISIFIAFLFMGLFDHYFWTLQQGRLTLWLVAGMLLALSSKK